MRSLIGVYVGASTSEFAFAPQEDCSMSGTGGANSITSNRISFCLGMQGTTAMSRGLELDTGHDGTLSTTEDFELDITESMQKSWHGYIMHSSAGADM